MENILAKMQSISQRMLEPSQFNDVFLKKKVEVLSGETVQKKLVSFTNKDDFLHYYKSLKLTYSCLKPSSSCKKTVSNQSKKIRKTKKKGRDNAELVEAVQRGCF